MVASNVGTPALRSARPALVDWAVARSAALALALRVGGNDLHAWADVAHHRDVVGGADESVGGGVAVLEHSLGQVLLGDAQVGVGGETHAGAVVAGSNIGLAGGLDVVGGGLLGDGEDVGHRVGSRMDWVAAVVLNSDGEVGSGIIVASPVTVLVSVVVLRLRQGSSCQDRGEGQLGEHVCRS